MFDENVCPRGQDLGCDEKGCCWAEEDPIPSDSCSYFEDADPEDDDDEQF